MVHIKLKIVRHDNPSVLVNSTMTCSETSYSEQVNICMKGTSCKVVIRNASSVHTDSHVQTGITSAVS